MKFIPPPFDIWIERNGWQNEIKGFALVVLWNKVSSRKPTNPRSLFKVVKAAQKNEIEHTAIWYSGKVIKDKDGQVKIEIFNPETIEKEKKDISDYLKKPFWIVSGDQIVGLLDEEMSNKYSSIYLDEKQYSDKVFSRNSYQLKCQLCPVVEDDFDKIDKCIKFVV